MIFIEYPKCTTCKKAKKFLIENNIEFIDRDIVESNPTKEELKLWIEKSGLPINKFFNTSGKLYREMGLKDKVRVLEQDELLDILASDGMLVKRPILINDNKVLVGFKEEDWTNAIK
ncbi:Spx/MgsR family RNA polymerase-binding regulatory protein [Clostridium chauvoei]|uniref:Spx/MgsR family RNA polymerase-binding regulatory protein n=2 Tax=Clostridium chauvoei TaxID=46867 RepID=A0ABD4RH70_9CLOT|nr:Spx/MgsR family RNA polymerase-binding regulatory protein [Clostridium chauvoei]ATD53978.1 ArsC family transcriptional regulator [Clostridium chauvoei]ATD58224.1 ArsC family transcriptional regulator [Clostridium chauvoei]MBX7280624.1 Spx/MgsR family RNA polymerase-binding regulatory protein [Clostridium chauvoei]MBX7283048.1 Spx/MgsR family RNA polymerase-binding regulatory protein [Clostridium chauvoei]MBX7285422.1 Spx/MgsR family RNA polymerase-binding regulatory protein [Clostridium cha